MKEREANKWVKRFELALPSLVEDYVDVKDAIDAKDAIDCAIKALDKQIELRTNLREFLNNIRTTAI